MSEKVLRISAVIQQVGLSRSSIYAAIQCGRFPKQIKLSVRTVGWLESSIQEWIRSRHENQDSMTVES